MEVHVIVHLLWIVCYIVFAPQFCFATFSSSSFPGSSSSRDTASSEQKKNFWQRNDTLATALQELDLLLMADMTSSDSDVTPLTSQQTSLLRQRLDALYATLLDSQTAEQRQPQRRERRRKELRGRRESTIVHKTSKRSKEMSTLDDPFDGYNSADRWRSPPPGWRGDVAQPSCPSRAAWLQLRSAVDVNNTAVVVYQPEVYPELEPPSSLLPPGTAGQAQWFYAVTCRSSRAASAGGSAAASTGSAAGGTSSTAVRHCSNCCFGVDHSRFKSSCEQKQTYVRAVVRRSDDVKSRYTWSWIQVDTSCGCAVTPRTTTNRLNRP